MKKVFRNAIEYQFNVPNTMEKNKFDKENFSAKESASDENIGIIDFSRPSDFRLKAVKTKKIQFVDFVIKLFAFLLVLVRTGIFFLLITVILEKTGTFKLNVASQCHFFRDT